MTACRHTPEDEIVDSRASCHRLQRDQPAGAERDDGDTPGTRAAELRHAAVDGGRPRLDEPAITRGAGRIAGARQVNAQVGEAGFGEREAPVAARPVRRLLVPSEWRNEKHRFPSIRPWQAGRWQRPRVRPRTRDRAASCQRRPAERKAPGASQNAAIRGPQLGRDQVMSRRSETIGISHVHPAPEDRFDIPAPRPMRAARRRRNSRWRFHGPRGSE